MYMLVVTGTIFCRQDRLHVPASLLLQAAAASIHYIYIQSSNYSLDQVYVYICYQLQVRIFVHVSTCQIPIQRGNMKV